MHESDPEIIALAESWASADGKSRQFHDPKDIGGYREGYLSDALDLAIRLKGRGYMIVQTPLEEVVR